MWDILETRLFDFLSSSDTDSYLEPQIKEAFKKLKSATNCYFINPNLENEHHPRVWIYFKIHLNCATKQSYFHILKNDISF